MKKKTAKTKSAASPKKNGMPRWKHRLELYRADELSKLAFDNDEEIDAAIDLVWVGRLQGMPFSLGPDGHSFVIPKKAVHYFIEKGIRFTQVPLAKPKAIA